MGRLGLFIFPKIKTHSWPVCFVDTENVDHVLSHSKFRKNIVDVTTYLYWMSGPRPVTQDIVALYRRVRHFKIITRENGEMYELLVIPSALALYYSYSQQALKQSIGCISSKR